MKHPRWSVPCILFASTWAVLLPCVGAIANQAVDGKPWPVEKAKAWGEQQGWLVGCNFIPSTAINQLEMWQADSFDPATIDRELGYAESLGFNSVRVFLHDQLWLQDAKGFLDRMDRFLDIASRHHIRTMFVLFDSCWRPGFKLGKQPSPVPFTHNSGWVQNPGREVLANFEKYSHLKEYTQGVLRRFGKDPRVVVWDVWNEPDNTDGDQLVDPKTDVKFKERQVARLMARAFYWAREANPSQPLTSGLWKGNWGPGKQFRHIEQLQVDGSDVISFHTYQDAKELGRMIGELGRFGRPVICTEYMARPHGSTFDPNLGLLRSRGVGAYCWGLVAGKTQTMYPWDSWNTKYTAEPPLWFHDVFRNDGSPYDAKEVEYIRRITSGK